MTGSFILDYYLLVFIASCGLFQIIGALNNLHGILILNNKSASIIVGLTVIVVAFAWFFLSEDRNVPDSTLGLNGNQQFAYFFAGSGTGLATTLALSSLRHWRLGTGRLGTGRLGKQNANRAVGLDALRETTYLWAIYRVGRRLLLRRGDGQASEDQPTAR